MTVAARVTFRRARHDDLDACIHIWRTGIDDYQGRLNMPPMPADTSHLGRLLSHVLATDPERFWVAEDPGDVEGVVGFASATVRGSTWFLGMLFVDPGAQRDGLGTALLERAIVGRELLQGERVDIAGAIAGEDGVPIDRWGTCTDAAQPISNALYSRVGIVPRVPIWRLSGELRESAPLPSLPRGFTGTPFEDIAGGREGHRRLADVVNAIDDAVLGFEHPLDHAWLRREGLRGVLVSDEGGRPVGYGYASAVGRVGPIAALDPVLLAPIAGHVFEVIPANGARAAWIPGTAAGLFRDLMRAGLRLDGFPGLLCWADDRPPFDRYVPISLALL